MFGMASLDVMIGIITVYLIFALACTAIVEVFSAWCEVRSKNLEVALTEFLHGSIADNSRFVDAFFAHPVVQTLSVGEHGHEADTTPASSPKTASRLPPCRPTTRSGRTRRRGWI